MFLLRWLMPWRRQKAQAVAPPQPTEFIELTGFWRINQRLEGDTGQTALVAAFVLSRGLEAEASSVHVLLACYPKAQSVAMRTLFFELSGAFGLNHRLAGNVELNRLLTAFSAEYNLKGEL